jgi:hypothetical protein
VASMTLFSGMEELKRHPPKKSLFNNLISGLLVVGSCLHLRSLPEVYYRSYWIEKASF